MLLGNRLGNATEGVTSQLNGAMPTGQSIDQQQMAGKVWGEFLRARTERLQRDYEWWVCWQWYNGDCSVFLDRQANAGTIYRVTSRRPRHKRNLPLNLIGSAIDLLVAKQMRAEPVFQVAPVKRAAMGAQRARMAAREARDLVRYFWDKNELEAERRILFLDRNITGNSFVKVFWDANREPFKNDIQACPMCQGQGIAQPPPDVQAMVQQVTAAGGIPPPMPQMPCPQCTPQGQPRGTGTIDRGRKPLGDVSITPVSPWEVWPVAGAKNIKQGFFHGYKVTKEQASKDYAIPPDQLMPSANLERGESQFATLARLNRVETKNEENAIWVVEKWLPPLPGTESPRVTVLVGNQLVWPKPGAADYTEDGSSAGVPPYRRVPMFHFRLRPSAETFWSTGIVMDMISANDFVNRARASFHRHQQTMAFTKWFYEEGSIDPDRLVAEEGEAVPFRGSSAPEQRAPASMPQFYVDLMKNEMEYIPQLAGLQEIDRGIAPPNLEAFQALHFMAEQAETMHGPVYIEDKRQWLGISWAALRCAVFKYKPADQRLLAVNGTSVEVQALLEMDLSDSIDIRCEIGDALAHSPALRTEMVYRAVEIGIATPAEVKASGLFDFGIIGGEDVDDRRMQESVAYMENQQMEKGMGHFIATVGHDHAVHLQVHRRALLEAQIENNGQLVQELEAACEAHYQMIQASMAPAGPAPKPNAKAASSGAKPPQPPGQANPLDGQQQSAQY